VTQALLGVETVLLALIGLLVVGLLRSHAEILRRLERGEGVTPVPRPRETSTGKTSEAAADVHGTTPSGGARRIALSPGSPNTLLAFLTSGCSSCKHLLADLRQGLPELPGDTRLVVVTKDREVEQVVAFRPIEKVVDVVMSSAAWADYRVPGSPFFVHVSGEQGLIAGEGSATTWEQVTSLLLDAIYETRDQDADIGRIEAELAAAGIRPGHPSLRPSAQAPE
jgi:hypothetical protein